MRKIWTTLVRVSGDATSLILSGHGAAYVWMAASAPDRNEFKGTVEACVIELGLRLVSMEEIRTEEEVEMADTPSTELVQLITEARQDESRPSIGRFYRFTSEDLERSPAPVDDVVE